MLTPRETTLQTLLSDGFLEILLAIQNWCILALNLAP